MSALDSLIRLHRWQLDERRRQLADLDQLANQLREEECRLDAEQRSEQAAANTSPVAAFAYAGYARTLIERRQKLAQSLAEVQEQIARASETLAEAFQEVKRYEITAANRARQQLKRIEQRQQRILDDVAIDGYRRRSASGG